MAGIITDTLMEQYRLSMAEEEKSRNTIEKYMRDILKFRDFAGEKQEITKELVIEYKQYLREHYKISSANFMLAALNSFLKWAGWGCGAGSKENRGNAFWRVLRLVSPELSF